MATKSIAPDITGAVADFLAKYAVPAVPAESILCGNQNNVALPETNDYIIFTTTQTVRHGTTAETWADDGTLRLTVTTEVLVQVDCYADSRNGTDATPALLRAQAIETVARSYLGPAFFAPYGISCLFADEPRDTTVSSDDSGGYLRRWTTTLHLSCPMGVEVTEDYFDAVTVNVENVEVHHPA